MTEGAAEETLKLLEESARRIVADAHPFETHRMRAAAEHPDCLPTWKALAENGLLGATVAEDLGGAGLPSRASALVAQALALNLAPDPYVESMVVAAWLLEHGLHPNQAAKWLGPIVEGASMAGFAHGEDYHPDGPENILASAELRGDTWYVSGRKTGVRAGGDCDWFVVSARIVEEDAIGLFLVEAEDESVQRSSFRTFDGAVLADVTFTESPAVHRLFQDEEVWRWLQRVQNRADAILGSQAVVLMEKLLTDTVDYLKTRKQFGVEIGQFQALQHRASDMFVAVEEAKAMASLAVDALDEERDVSDPLFPATRICIAETAMKVAHDAIQLHGGMGVSDELFISHGAKRLKAIAHAFGDETFHERRHGDGLLAELEGAA